MSKSRLQVTGHRPGKDPRDRQLRKLNRIIAQLVAALDRAKEVIKIWYDIRGVSKHITKEKAAEAWKIYERESPEMKQINAALRKAAAHE